MLPPFFDRVYGAIGGHLAVSRESLNQRLEATRVGVSLAADHSEGERLIAEMAVNLLARLYPRLGLSAPSRTHSDLAAIATRINPQIELADGFADDWIDVGYGRHSIPVVAAADGWNAFVGGRSRGDGGNIYSSAAAASLAAGALFRRVFCQSSPEPEFGISLLSYEAPDLASATAPLVRQRAEEVWYVGVGAVGNAGLWCVARDTELGGMIRLIDPETLSLSNLQRYTLGYLDAVGQPKVRIGLEEFRSSSASVETAESTLEEFASRNPTNVPTAIVVSVDNIGGRRSAQALLPRFVINGWTGERALGASWHQFNRNAACLACLYHPRGLGPSATEQAAKALGLPVDRATVLWVTRRGLELADVQVAATNLGVELDVLAPWIGKSLGDLYTDVVCGAVPLDVGGVGRLELVPLAHQSALAGVLMAAEFRKRLTPSLARASQPETLVSYDDILRRPGRTWKKPRAREPGCICGDGDYQAVYADRWSSS